MRCSVCDFSDGEARSLYNTSLIDPKGSRKRYVMYDKYRGEEICNVCYTPPAVRAER
jgi:hypothetical protein